MTAIDDIARHGHGVDDEDTSGHLPRHAALKVMLTDACWRCSDGDGVTCDPCLSELVAKAERDAEARTVLTHLRGLFDPMTGRPAGGAW